jgi:hypothetical protein
VDVAVTSRGDASLQDLTNEARSAADSTQTFIAGLGQVYSSSSTRQSPSSIILH